MHEVAHATGLGVRPNGPAVPIRPPVVWVCEMLGYDPMFLACEGRVVAVVAAESADAALATWRALPQGSGAAVIGRVRCAERHVVLEDDALPRIC